MPKILGIDLGTTNSAMAVMEVATFGLAVVSSLLAGILRTQLRQGEIITETGLERPLLIINDLPGTQVTSEIRPSKTIGAADLRGGRRVSAQDAWHPDLGILCGDEPAGDGDRGPKSWGRHVRAGRADP